MGRVSPGMAGGVALISSVSSARARATRAEPGWSSWTVIAAGAQVMVPARPRMMVWRVVGAAGGPGGVELDGDRGGGPGDGAGHAADDGLAGDSAVLVVVAEVGVE